MKKMARITMPVVHGKWTVLLLQHTTPRPRETRAADENGIKADENESSESAFYFGGGGGRKNTP